MPARTVIFTNVRKFDGKDFRWLSGGEYIQMSGRAGRRGKDKEGLVFLMCDEKMDAPVGKALLKGESDKLNSAFHLTYNMVLNLLRVEELNPEYMLQKCFFQFQNQSDLPEKEAELQGIAKDRDAVKVANETAVAEYHLIRDQLSLLTRQLRDVVMRPEYVVPFLNPGRLVEVKSPDDDWGWGAVVNFSKKQHPTQSAAGFGQNYIYVVEVLLHCAEGTDDGGIPRPCPEGATGEMVVVPVLLEMVNKISSVRIYIAPNLRLKDSRFSVLKSIKEVKKRFPDGIPQLDPKDDMKIPTDKLVDVVSKIETMERRMFAHVLHEAGDTDALLTLYSHKLALIERHKELKKEIKLTKSILQLDELKRMKRVLRRLEFTTADDVVTLKGRVACEISSGDSLVLTEMIFNGVFNDLNVNQVVSLVTCFVFDEKSKDPPPPSEEMETPLRAMQDTARRIAKIRIDCKIELNEEEFVESFRVELMDIAYRWCDGAKFSEIMQLTEVYEGSIIRVMRRLEELLRQLCMAAKAIGNTELENKFATGITKIKRDIIFASSLYL